MMDEVKGYHDFNENLQYSFSREGKLDKIYEQYFQSVGAIARIARVTPLKRQKNGIDTEITLNSGETITVQEKWRTREYSGDILLEYCSVYPDKIEKKAGWIETINADYLFTVYAPSLKVIVYPVMQLRLAWQANKEEWKQKYTIPPARNDGYVTLNVAVPTEILNAAITKTTELNYES